MLFVPWSQKQVLVPTKNLMGLPLFCNHESCMGILCSQKLCVPADCLLVSVTCSGLFGFCLFCDIIAQDRLKLSLIQAGLKLQYSCLSFLSSGV